MFCLCRKRTNFVTRKESECSAVGSVLRSGRRGRAFESPHSDIFLRPGSLRVGPFCFLHEHPFLVSLQRNETLPAGKRHFACSEATKVSAFIGYGDYTDRDGYKTPLFPFAFFSRCYTQIMTKNDLFSCTNVTCST